MAAAPALALVLVTMVMQASAQQALVIDSGSTNRPGMTVTLEETGKATAQPRNSQPKAITLDQQLCQALMKDIKAAGTLSAVPVQHCAKSASFGSSLYVEFNGDRSPDLSCANQPDPRAAALQKAANDILQAVHSQIGPSRLQPVRPVRPAQ